MALLEWYRAAELSCDRAATLVNRDPLVTCRTLMVLAAGMPSKKLNLDAFVKQGIEYEEWEPGWDKLSRLRIELGQTHAFPVKRVHEVMRWVRSGEYDRIVGGEYVRRGDPVSARAEAGEAFDHYSRALQDDLRRRRRGGRAGGGQGRRGRREGGRLAQVALTAPEGSGAPRWP